MIRDIVTANENIKPNSKEIQALKEHFPACFDNDGNFDLDRFKEYLSDKLIVKNEGYELRFLGKNYSRLLASLDTETVIEPDAEHNAKAENANSQNIYISGDNLDGLKQLLKSYSGSVKCIYIDPPYNTGSDGFVYNDKFNFTAEQISERLSISEEQAAKILDLARRGSASHSAWLMFMYPRLQLARDLLSNDGVIFISIDDNEQANLKLICDDVFGEENFVDILHWKRKKQPSFLANHTAKVMEYILVYASNKDILQKLSVETISDETKKVVNLNNNVSIRHFSSGVRVKIGDNGVIKKGIYRIKTMEIEYMQDVYYSDGITQNDVDVKALFSVSQEKIDRYIRDKLLFITVNKGLRRDVSEEETSKAKSITDLLLDWGDNQDSEKEIQSLFDTKVFDYAKPVQLISNITKCSTAGEDIILDFFSGSGTTAHAVMAMNAKDGGNRKYIMVQLQEPVQSGSEAEKAGYKTIDEIGIERIKRAAKKIREEYPDTTADLGFKHYTLREVAPELEERLEDFSLDSNLGNDIILDVFGEETVLATFLVRDGYGFNAQYEVLDLEGYRAYYIKNHLYLLSANFSDEALAKLQRRFDEDSDFNPQNVVLFAYSFDWRALDLLKANLRHFKNTDKNLQLNFDMRY